MGGTRGARIARGAVAVWLGLCVALASSHAASASPVAPTASRLWQTAVTGAGSAIVVRARAIRASLCSPGSGKIGGPKVTVARPRWVSPRPLGMISAVPATWTGTIGAPDNWRNGPAPLECALGKDPGDESAQNEAADMRPHRDARPAVPRLRNAGNAAEELRNKPERQHQHGWQIEGPEKKQHGQQNRHPGTRKRNEIGAQYRRDRAARPNDCRGIRWAADENLSQPCTCPG